MKYKDAEILVDYILRSGYMPNAWEQDFMDTIMDKDKDLTDKQEFCLNRIYEKSSGGGRYQKQQHI